VFAAIVRQIGRIEVIATKGQYDYDVDASG